MTNRTTTLERKTKETQVQVALDLDGTGMSDIATGVPFLDHMLRHVAVHGLFDLQVRAQGDLEIDAHHTAEDVAIVLGEALDRALGERRSITRIAHSFVPMDEAFALVAIDLSGRGYAVVEAEFLMPMLGTMPASLVAHFLETLAVHARMNLHARVFYGRDDHHKAEALFKALGRALGQAVSVDPRRQVVSTKGTL
jgi:imidazoleglycerol-phosphate dehydratase